MLENEKLNISVYAYTLWLISLTQPYIFSAILASASKQQGAAKRMNQSLVRTDIWQEEPYLVWWRGGKELKGGGSKEED